ncbi:MAG: NPCBM/NEW2 domain-containing protein [Planctomycetota bacterium]
MRAGAFLPTLLLLAGGPGAPDHGASGPLRVTTVTGETMDLSSPSLADGLLTGRVAGEERKLPLDGLWKLEDGAVAARAPVERAGLPAFVELRGMPPLEGKLVGGDAEGLLRFRLAGGGEVAVPRQLVYALRLEAVPKPAAEAEAEKPAEDAEGGAAQDEDTADLDGGFDRSYDSPPEASDRVFARDPKGRIRGFGCTVLGVADGNLSVRRGERVLSLPLDRLYGVVFGRLSGLAPPVREAGKVRARVELADGRRLGGTLVGLDDDKVVLRVVDGCDLGFPRKDVSAVELLSDRLLYLSELEVQDRIQREILGREWPILVDHGEGDRPLALGKETFRRGYLVVPGTGFAWKLPRTYDRVEGLVGMPEAAVGSARVRFVSEGEELGPPLELHADGVPRKLSLPLRGAKELRIEVEATADLDAGGRVVLGDLRVVQEKPR